MKEYTAAIVGGGPGGYVTAIRLAQYGIDAVVFEAQRIGGVCLNRGCIPTKTLVKSAEVVSEIRHASEYGVIAEKIAVDFPAMMERKNRVVEQLVSGVELLFRKRNIPVIAELVRTIRRDGDRWILSAPGEEVSARYVVLATGSLPRALPGIDFDDDVLSSDGVLELRELPASMAVIGGGVIGCEFASIFNRLGVPVEIIEFLPNILSTEDREIATRMSTALKKNGVVIHTKTGVERVEKVPDGVVLHLSNEKTVQAEKALLSVGRQPHLEIEFPDGEPTREKGAAVVDGYCRTNLPNLFAIGDLTAKMLLAHTASAQGLRVAAIIRDELAGRVPAVEPIEYENIPRCTFTDPECASIGLTEEQAKERFGEIHVGKSSFAANGKALGLGQTFGLVKTISDTAEGLIRGVHIIGPQATELIAAAGVLIGAKIPVEKAAKLIYAHPTLSEALAEAVEDLEDLAIHKV
jgi:dihydrolipoamide dehydrogenase